MRQLIISSVIAVSWLPAVAGADQRTSRRPAPPPVATHVPCSADSHAGHDSNSSAVQDEHYWLFCRSLSERDASHKAVASGQWSNPATWGGRMPDSGAKVAIPRGMSVTVDRELHAALFWVRVAGVLRFATDVNTALTVDTLAIDESGRLEIGTAPNPVQPGVTARIIISARDNAPIDHTWDPLELTRGLIATGGIEMHGAAKTPFVSISTLPAVGSRSLILDAAPAGWRPGDELVLTATAYDRDETFRLERVDGTTIYLDRPIANTRTFPVDANGRTIDGLKLHLANFTRNVQVRTATQNAGQPKLQGHVMLMHRGGGKLAWVGLHDLGRTLVAPVTDPVLTTEGRNPGVNPAVGISEENVRGRYALHFHRAGSASSASAIEGCAITVRRLAGFKIGVGNHSSNVSVRRCVSHNVDGSHFFTEEGDELGDFTGNLAIHSVGSGFVTDPQPRDALLKNDPPLYHRRRLDVGHRGTGFWLNGGGVDVIDNIAAGQANAGFNLWTTPLNWRINDTYAVRFPVTNLRDKSWASGEDISIEDVPSRLINNTVYANSNLRNRGEGSLIIAGHTMHTKSRFPAAPYSQIHGFLSWNAGGVGASYSGNLYLKDVRVIGTFSRGSGRGDSVGIRLGTQGGNHGIVENATVIGFVEGVRLPSGSTLKGGKFATNVAIPVGGSQHATIDISDITFERVPELSRSTGPRSSIASGRRVSYDVYVHPIFNGGQFDPRTAFAPQPIYVTGHKTFPKAQLYSVEQLPNYILPDLGVPGLLDGKTTTGEAWEKYRLAPGGAVAPPGAAPVPGIRSNGVIGPAVIASAPTSQSYAAPAARRAPAPAAGARDSSVLIPSQSRMSSRAAARSGEQNRQRQENAGDNPDPSASARARDSQQDSGDRSSPRSQPADTRATPQETMQERQARRAAAQQERSSRLGSERTTTAPTAADSAARDAGPVWQLVSEGGQWNVVAVSRRVQLPAVSAGGDQTISLNEAAALNGSAGGRAAMTSIRWSRAYGNGTVTFDDPARLQTRARFSAPGLYVLHLTVADANGLRNTGPVTIIVEP